MSKHRDGRVTCFESMPGEFTIHTGRGPAIQGYYMKLKSLLLASAAVLIAVPAARAADAIIAEPEPVEYVRVCDAYGAGWFYIPGTETCLKFDGDVRVQYGFTHYHDKIPGDDLTSHHEWNYRARLNVRANNETEYGTLSSRIRFVANSTEGGHNDVLSAAEGPSSAPTVVDTAYIKLAGFNIGFDDSYWHRGADYGYYEARFDGLYIFHNGIYADYTYETNGLSLTVGVEDGNNSGEAGAPDLYAGFTYSAGKMYLAGVVYNDSSASAQAWKVRADFDLSDLIPGGRLGGFYMSDDGETDYVKGHLWGVTAAMNVTDKMILFAGYSDYADQYFGSPLNAAPNNVAAVSGSAKNWTVGVAWDVVPGLRIQPEYTVTTYNMESVADGQMNNGTFSLRVERSF